MKLSHIFYININWTWIDLTANTTAKYESTEYLTVCSSGKCSLKLQGGQSAIYLNVLCLGLCAVHLTFIQTLLIFVISHCDICTSFSDSFNCDIRISFHMRMNSSRQHIVHWEVQWKAMENHLKQVCLVLKLCLSLFIICIIPLSWTMMQCSSWW